MRIQHRVLFRGKPSRKGSCGRAQPGRFLFAEFTVSLRAMKGFKRSVYHLLLCKQPRTVSVTYLHLRFTFFFVSTNKRLSSCFLVKKRRKKRGHNRLHNYRQPCRTVKHRTRLQKPSTKRATERTLTSTQTG